MSRHQKKEWLRLFKVYQTELRIIVDECSLLPSGCIDENDAIIHTIIGNLIADSPLQKLKEVITAYSQTTGLDPQAALNVSECILDKIKRSEVILQEHKENLGQQGNAS